MISCSFLASMFIVIPSITSLYFIVSSLHRNLFKILQKFSNFPRPTIDQIYIFHIGGYIFQLKILPTFIILYKFTIDIYKEFKETGIYGDHIK